MEENILNTWHIPKNIIKMDLEEMVLEFGN